MALWNVWRCLFLSVILSLELSGSAKKLDGELSGPRMKKMPALLTHFSNSVGLTLSCEGEFPVSINWLDSGGEPLAGIPGVREQLQNGSLHFFPFKEGEYIPQVHNGGYRCALENPVGRILSPIFSIRAVMDHPFEAVIRSDDTLGNEGSPSLLVCDISPKFYSNFKKVVGWKEIDRFGHAKEIQFDKTRYLMTCDGSLLLPFSLPQQLFVCVVENVLSRQVQTSQPFLFKRKESGRAFPPNTVHIRKLCEENTNYELSSSSPASSFQNEIRTDWKTGKRLDLLCLADGKPAPAFRWEKYEEKLQKFVPIFEEGTQMGPLLRLQSLKGLYRCEASNTGGKKSANYSISENLTNSTQIAISPSKLNLRRGQNIELECKYSPSSTSSFIWFKNGKELSPQKTFGGKMQISNVRLEDQGIYQCFDQGGTMMAASELVFPPSPPELLHTFISQSLQPGPSLSFKCSAVGNPRPKIFWNVDGVELTGFHRFTVGDLKDEASSGEIVSFLNISEVRVEDSGLYSCRASNLVASVQHSARLNVYGRIFVKEMRPVTLTHGETIQIPCPFGGYPVDKIVWEKEGAKLGNKFLQLPNGTLQIGGILEEDKGSYTCLVSNRRGETASGVVHVNVMRAPNISPFKFDNNLSERQRTSVSCNVISGDLPITVEWKKDDKPLPRNLNLTETKLKFLNVLMFEDLQNEHSGVYTCSASNAVKTVEQSARLEVKVPPKWTSESKSVIVKGVVKSDVVLNCEVTGVPFPTISWFREDEGLKIPLITSQKYKIEQNGLKISGVEEKDAFVYICEANNGVGPGISRSIQLEVIIPAKTKAVQRSITTAEGSQATLECQIKGDRPVEVTWKKERAEVDSRFAENLSEVNSTLLLAQLLISHTSLSNSGRYICTASNQFGRDEDAINLEVKARPNSPEDLRVEEIGSRFIRLRWSTKVTSSVPLTHLILQWKSSSEDWESVQNKSIRFPSSQAIIQSLIPVTTYQIRLFAGNDIGQSLPSQPLTVLTLPEAPSGPPTNVSAVPISAKSVLVKWLPPEETLQHGAILGYQIIASMQSPFPRNVSLVEDEKWREEKKIEGLRPHSQYRISVKAYNSAGLGPESSPLFIQTPEGAPDSPPLGLQCEPLSPKSLQVQWDPPPAHLSNGQILGYKVFYTPSGKSTSGERPEVKKTSNRETTLHGLKSFTSYAVRALAYTLGGESEPSSAVICTTEEDVPEPPEDIKVLLTGPSSLLITWLPPKSPNGLITKYTLYWKTSESDPVREKQVVSVSPEPFTELRKLKESQYSFWVTASTSAGVGRPSKTEQIHLLNSNKIPAKIASFPLIKNVQIGESLLLPCKVVGNPQPKLIWKIDQETTLSVNNILRNGSYFISSVSDGDEGEYTCQIENELGSDAISHKIVISRPPPPVQLHIGYVTDSSLHCHWDPVKSQPSISAFILEWKEQEKRKWNSIRLSSFLTSYSLEGLRCGTHFVLKLTPENKIGRGEPSPEVKARTNGHPPSSSPRLTEILDGNGTMIRIDLRRWPDGGCSLTNFQIEFKRDEGIETWKRIYRKDNDTKVFTMKGLQPHDKYAIKVKVENDAGSVQKTFLVESHPDFFRNYAKVLERVELEQGSSNAEMNGERNGNGSNLPFYTNPHVLVPIVSAVICTFALTACLLILLVRRKNHSKQGDWRAKGNISRQHPQQSWLNSGTSSAGNQTKFGEMISSKCDEEGTEECMSIYATLNSSKAIPNTIRDSTVRLHSFCEQDNYDAAPPLIYQRGEQQKKKRKKSLRSSSPSLEDLCMEQVSPSCHLDFPDKIDPPHEFRSSSGQPQNIYHVHHPNHRLSYHSDSDEEEEEVNVVGGRSSRGTVRPMKTKQDISILHNEYSSPYQLNRVPSASSAGDKRKNGGTLKKSQAKSINKSLEYFD